MLRTNPLFCLSSSSEVHPDPSKPEDRKPDQRKTRSPKPESTNRKDRSRSGEKRSEKSKRSHFGRKPLSQTPFLDFMARKYIDETRRTVSPDKNDRDKRRRSFSPGFRDSEAATSRHDSKKSHIGRKPLSPIPFVDFLARKSKDEKRRTVSPDVKNDRGSRDKRRSFSPGFRESAATTSRHDYRKEDEIEYQLLRQKYLGVSCDDDGNDLQFSEDCAPQLSPIPLEIRRSPSPSKFLNISLIIKGNQKLKCQM